VIKYELYSGAGNDFVMIDNFNGIIPFDKQEEFTVKICNEQFKELDGVIFVDKPKYKYSSIRMNYFNRDGSFGAMCGNGARCTAMFAHKHGIIRENKFTLEAVDDFYTAEICDEINVKITFPEPAEIKTDIAIKAEFGEGLKNMDVSYVNVGSDHLVIFMDDVNNKTALNNKSLKNLDVNHIGEILRYHNEFQPRGANINFVQPLSKREIQLRTYERGVERETLACGTGIVSAGIISVMKSITTAPVRVLVQSGEWLTVELKLKNNSITGLSLTGSARKVSEGEISEDKL
jgi:diaminopimelate epimerase